jgi:hypothetical protein
MYTVNLNPWTTFDVEGIGNIYNINKTNYVIEKNQEHIRRP